MNIHPLFDCVVLRSTQAETTTESGFILTRASEEHPQCATVVAVGPGGMIDGQEIQMLVSPGQTVVFSKNVGSTVKLNDGEYIFVHQKDLLAFLD